MPVIKCKMCGGDLNIVDDSTVCECEYCGTKQTVPKVDDEKKLKLFERANRLRTACEFDKAAGVYESVVADFDEEAEAYWGLILCKFGIEYVDDPATGNKIPTCHRSSFDSLMDDPNFDMVMECADPIARKVYREEAKQIEELRKRIIEVSSQEEPYDIFISYKELDDEGQRTLDSVIAQDIYSELTEKGYRVFFSRISLEDKLGVEYEPYIFAALNSAKVMLVVGTDYDYFNAVWVKNEWSRFLMLIASGQKKTLIPVFKGIDAYDMPKEFRKLAAQDMGKVGAMQDLVRGVEKLMGKKGAAETSTEQPVVVQSGGPNIAALLGRGFLALEDQEWSKAQDLFDQVLNMDFKNAEAYLGLAMSELKCSDRSALRNVYVSRGAACRSNKHLARAKQFGNTELAAWFERMDEDAQVAEKEAAEKARIERETRERAEREAAEKERIELEKKRQKELEAIEKRRTRIQKFLLQRFIAAGYSHSVGVKEDGKVIAAGSNYSGQCNVTGWTEIKAIAANDFLTIGLKKNGTVLTTGNNDKGQRNVSEWTDIIAIATGGNHSVGLKGNGRLVATGENKDGQCNLSSWTDVLIIDAGSKHTVGLMEDGRVVAAGNNEFGQCDTNDWDDIVAIAAGGSHTVGLKADGTVVAVGNNEFGQCNVCSWNNVVAIAAGFNHTIGVKVDGTVIAVGNNDRGQCNVSRWTNIISAAAGDNHTVGLKEDGKVFAVGADSSGQCNVDSWKLFDDFQAYKS